MEKNEGLEIFVKLFEQGIFRISWLQKYISSAIQVYLWLQFQLMGNVTNLEKDVKDLRDRVYI